jgi:hypothetical protein
MGKGLEVKTKLLKKRSSGCEYKIQSGIGEKRTYILFSPWNRAVEVDGHCLGKAVV